MHREAKEEEWKRWRTAAQSECSARALEISVNVKKLAGEGNCKSQLG
jgi:hypothetical protein